MVVVVISDHVLRTVPANQGCSISSSSECQLRSVDRCNNNIMTTGIKRPGANYWSNRPRLDMLINRLRAFFPENLSLRRALLQYLWP